jgi:broad specificity phosphatase PhoE
MTPIQEIVPEAVFNMLRGSAKKDAMVTLRLYAHFIRHAKTLSDVIVLLGDLADECDAIARYYIAERTIREEIEKLERKRAEETEKLLQNEARVVSIFSADARRAKPLSQRLQEALTNEDVQKTVTGQKCAVRDT